MADHGPRRRRATVIRFLMLGAASAALALPAERSFDIQRAVERGGSVRLPRGTYRLTKPVVIDLDKHGPASITSDGTATVVMAGPGPAFHFIGTHTRGSADPKTVQPNVWERQRTPVLDGVEIVGAHPEADGVRAEGTMQATFTRLTIRRTRNAIYLTGRNRNVIISDCHLYENRGAGVLMENLNLHQVNIANSHISYNGGGGIVVRASEVRNLQIGTSDIEANMADGGPPAANVLLDVRSGTIREGSITGCSLQHSGKVRGSANIRFLGRSTAEPNKVGFFSIADNVISDVGVNVHLRHARGVSISGNTFALGYEHDVLVEGSSNVVIGPNVLDQNPDYNSGEFHNGIMFTDSSDSTLSGVHITGAVRNEAAIVLRRCRRFNLTGSTILDSDGAGILLDETEWTQVSGNLIHDRRATASSVAIRVRSGSRNVVRNNLLQGSVEGPVDP